MRAGQGSDADVVWDREVDMLTASDNDATYVTLINVTGSGVLEGFGYDTNNNTQAVTVNVNADGDSQTFIMASLGAVERFVSIPLIKKYSSSLVVRMKLAGVGVAEYWAVQIVD